MLRYVPGLLAVVCAVLGAFLLAGAGVALLVLAVFCLVADRRIA